VGTPRNSVPAKFVELPSVLKESPSQRPIGPAVYKRSGNTAKMLQNRGAEPSILARRGARRTFSTC